MMLHHTISLIVYNGRSGCRNQIQCTIAAIANITVQSKAKNGVA